MSSTEDVAVSIWEFWSIVDCKSVSCSDYFQVQSFMIIHTWMAK